MKPYESYTIDDFIQDEDFRDWVQGNSNRESFWLSFLQQYPEQWETFKHAERFIRATNVTDERLSEAEVRKEANRFIERASAFIPVRHPAKAPRNTEQSTVSPFDFRWKLALATLLTVVLGISWYLSRPDLIQPFPHLAEASKKQLVETINDTQQPLRVVLNDSSEVLLSPKSRLRYPAQFTGNSRTVYLTGEASFSVKRQSQPFMVFTGEMVTRVLGTRFVVRAFDLDRNITVQVLSGKVSVYKAKAKQEPVSKEVSGLILYANQAALFEKTVGNLTKTLVANPSLLIKSEKEASFVYDEVPLPVILRELEKSYGIPIQFDEQNFAASRITATLSSESLYEKLDLLCKAASASYEITDGQIVISPQRVHAQK
ncbi:FecR family protein [Spirosoma fluviale]|uniref:FecR family protein n=1 Tax=Spirosoma fluviale TaxID=1597977 RepID=A0A286GP78_9BACT|nr:FecR family protein [Spirosoma fluviale]SOD97328.1 FecR family protein [Spirosoma fluviale]